MERLTESRLLDDSKPDPQASGWFADNVLHPFINGTGVKQLYNNFASDKDKAAPAYVPETKVLSTDWAVHNLASGAGAVLAYAAVGKATNVGLSAISSAAGLEGATARALTSATTAQIVGAGLYDFAKAPNAGETRLGNAAGSIAAFGAFSVGNDMLGANKTIANSTLLTGLGRVGVGMAGGLTALETSHLVSKALGVNNDLSRSDIINSMAGGGFMNVAMPVVQKGVSTIIDGAINSKPFQLPADDPSAKLAADTQKLPPIELRNGPSRLAGLVDLSDRDESKIGSFEAKARPARPVGEVDQAAELPRLILLKQQFDATARQAQVERVAGELAGFVGDAKKTLDTAIYDFRLDPKAESIVVGAYNKAADSGVAVRLAFFQPDPKASGEGLVGNVPSDATVPGQESMAHGPSPDLLSKLSPKIQVQKIALPAEPTVSIPDAYQDIVGSRPSGPILSRLVDLQNGKPGDFESGVNTHGIKGGGHLMHNKYVVRDVGTDNASVWTGSTNFTSDAFGSQDNNIIIMKSRGLADAYTRDFTQMWEKGALMGTGANLHTTVNCGDGQITVAFSPGDGAFIDAEYAKRLAAAKESVHIASMVISSPEMLKALTDDISRGVKVTGIYDGPQMDQVEHNWAKGKTDASRQKLEMWNELKGNLVRKESHPYAPNVVHDFLHDKMYAVDGENAGTGSFNFSKNATMNAENVVMMDNLPSVATQYTQYIDDLVNTYRGRAREGSGARPVPVPVKETGTGDTTTPSMSATEAQSTFKQMVADGKIPHGRFVDSVSGQNYPLSAKQLAVVLDIIAKARAKEASH